MLECRFFSEVTRCVLRFEPSLFLWPSLYHFPRRSWPKANWTRTSVSKKIPSWQPTNRSTSTRNCPRRKKKRRRCSPHDLRKAGYEVTDHFGQYDDPSLTSYGIVGVLKNGPGPVVYVRTELDALPIVEKTGLPYASHVKVERPGGGEVGVMHACGHDLHMAVFLGTARVLVEMKNHWSGTVVMIGQPAEETVGGAQAMIRAGLFQKFPKPDYVLALHDTAAVAAGKVSWHAGPLLAGADSVDITVRGYGGHGAAPQATKDPIVIASEIVVMLQTIVSREMDPQLPTVVTVGSFHSGTKHNIIPDDAHLQLTVRTMNPEQREKVLDGNRENHEWHRRRRWCSGRTCAHCRRWRKTTFPPRSTIRSSRAVSALRSSAPSEKKMCCAGEPIMASEDFSLFALEDPKPPICMFWLGAADPLKLKDAMEKGTRLPGPHSSEFAPVPDPPFEPASKP